MKHLKYFESRITESTQQYPQLGDYVILKYDESNSLNSFFISNIGRITEVIEDEEDYIGDIIYEYRVKYDNATKEVEEEIDDTYGYDDYNIFAYASDIEHFSSDRDELDIILTSKRFNI